MRKISVLWAAAYVAVGVAAFSVVAAVEQREKVHVVKVRQVPPVVPAPVEITREAYHAKSR
jgi:hypothetical protein